MDRTANKEQPVMLTRFLALVIAALAAASPETHACLELEGELPTGPATVVDRDGHLAAFSRGRVLVLLEVGGPAVVQEVGSAVLPAVIQGLDLSGDRAYVAAGRGGLVVVDTSTPAHPQVIPSTSFNQVPTAAFAVDALFANGYVFVAERLVTGSGPTARLRVVDVSDPEHPLTVGLVDGRGTACALAATGDLVLLADRDGGLRVIDVSDVANPIETARAGWGHIVDVDVVGNVAVVVTESGALVAYDLSDPEDPRQVARFEASFQQFRGVSVDGSIAYVAADWDGLRIIDVGNLNHPEEVASLATPDRAYAVMAADGLALVAASSAGLRVIDVADSALPTEVATVEARGSAAWITGSGDVAILSRASSAPFVVDLSDPERPSELAQLPISSEQSRCTGAAVSGTMAYVAYRIGYHLGCLDVVDISEPGTPVVVGTLGVPMETGGVAVAGAIVYLLGSPGGGLVIDVSNPSSPTPVGQVVTHAGGTPAGVVVEGDRAYVAIMACPWAFGCFSSLSILDISTPASPTELGWFPLGSGHSDFAVRDGYAYVPDEDFVRVLDVRDAGAIHEVAALGFGNALSDGLALGDRVVYVATSRCPDWTCSAAVRTVDVVDPAHPILVATYETPGSATAVSLASGLLVVANEDAGLLALDPSACGVPSPRRPAARYAP